MRFARVRTQKQLTEALLAWTLACMGTEAKPTGGGPDVAIGVILDNEGMAAKTRSGCKSGLLGHACERNLRNVSSVEW